MNIIEYIKQHFKLILILIALIVIGIGAYSYYLSVVRQGKVPFELSVLPSDAKITLNNAPAENGVNYIVAGTYTLKVTREGFADYSHDYIVGEQLTGTVITLSAVSDQAKQWAKDNRNALLENEGKQAKFSQQTVTYFSNKNPIVTSLPYKDPYYTIGYTTVDSKHLVITVYTSSPRYRYVALNKIRDIGYDPTDYTIQFIDFKNPLGETAK